MKNSIYKLLVVLALTNYSCGTGERYQPLDWKNSNTLKVVGIVKFPLDSQTKRYGNILSYSKKEDNLYLYNNYSHAIYKYSLERPNEYSIIKLDKSGPDGVRQINALYAISEDSLISINSATSKLTIINNSGKKIYEAEILSPDENGFPLMFRITSKDGKVYVPLSTYSKTKPSLKQKNLLIFDLRTRKKDFQIDTPVNYREIKDWADRFHMKSGTLINSSFYAFSWSPGKLFVLHNLEKNESKEIHFSSSLISDAQKADKIPTNSYESRYFQRTNSWNQSIYFAENQNILLRPFIIGKKIPENAKDLYGDFKSLNNDEIFEITEIYNSSMQKIGELKGVSFLNGIFDNINGIYMEDYSVDQENEDIMAFKVYQLDKVQ